jgi:hypothetical protein
MRTTLDLDADIIAAARSIAAARKQSMGKVVSDLVRQSLAVKVKKHLLAYRPYLGEG